MSQVDGRHLERVLKTVIKTGKYTLGLKGSLKSVKSAKLLIYSTSLREEAASKLQHLCRSSSTPVLLYPGTSVALGRLCGLFFRVSVISIRSPGDADLSPFTSNLNGRAD